MARDVAKVTARAKGRRATDPGGGAGSYAEKTDCGQERHGRVAGDKKAERGNGEDVAEEMRGGTRSGVGQEGERRPPPGIVFDMEKIKQAETVWFQPNAKKCNKRQRPMPSHGLVRGGGSYSRSPLRLRPQRHTRDQLTRPPCSLARSSPTAGRTVISTEATTSVAVPWPSCALFAPATPAHPPPRGLVRKGHPPRLSRAATSTERQRPPRVSAIIP